MLSSKKGRTRMVTREELRELPAPEPLGPWHKPVPHNTLVETLTAALHDQDLGVKQEQFAIGKHAIFGFMTTEQTTKDESVGLSVGFRSDNAQRFGVQIVCGTHVFVCDNMAINGEWVVCARKHTLNLDLDKAIHKGLEKIRTDFEREEARIERLRAWHLNDNTAKAFIFDLVHRGALPNRMAVPVYEEYQQSGDRFPAQSPWALVNACTEIAKRLPMPPRMRLLGAVSELERIWFR